MSEATCVNCSAVFAQPRSRYGRPPKRFCTFDCYLDSRRRTPDERRVYMRDYMRRRRHDGEPIARAKRSDGEGHVTQSGYRVLYRPGHPIAGRNGTAFEHRVILYERIGPGQHDCFWCGKQVSWEVTSGPGRLVADHLNHERLDNRAENLEPACDQCNGAAPGLRGRYLKLIGRT